MEWLRDRSIAIVGVAQTVNRRKSGLTALELAAEVVADLVRSTGIERDRIDGLASTLANAEASNAFWTNVMCETLGLSVRWAQATDIEIGRAHV
jgi:hypothetical protein